MFQKCPVCNSDINEVVECCPVCGFHLIGSTQKFSPVKIDNGSIHLAEKAIKASKRACILILSGITKGSTYDLKTDGSETILGRDPKCTIFLNDMTVSRNHASIFYEQDEWIIKDNGSYNGVWVNNKNVNSKVLQNGDIIQLGNFSLEFHASLNN